MVIPLGTKIWAGVIPLGTNPCIGVIPLGTGKPPRITQACGNKRFTAYDDSGVQGIPEAQPGPERPLTGASQGNGCLAARSSFLGDPEVLSRPLARDGLSPGDASGGTGGISGTMARRWPPAQTCRGRARIAKTRPRWRRSQGSPCLRPRCGLLAFFPSNLVVSPPPKQRRLVALHPWGFLRAIGPAVATRPPARSPVLRARGSGRPEPSSSSTPARPA